METRHLQALIAVADTGSVTRAAELLHVVQPAVTRYIRALETELGTELFERSRSGMRLTQVGRQVTHHARRALAELERAREEARSAQHVVRGIVTVGLLVSTARLLAPALVTEVTKRYPGVRLRVVTGYAGNLVQWLENGDVDVALLFDQPISPTFATTELIIEDLWAVMPKRTATSRPTQPIPLSDVLAKPLIVPSAPHGLRTLIDTAAARVGATVTIAVETNDADLQQCLVAAGHGWSVLPAIVATNKVPGVAMAPISDPTIRRTIVLAVPGRPAPSEAVRSVAGVLHDTAQLAVIDGRWPGARLTE
ncbi:MULTISPECIES: LysR substrate-binding domain-containing protein [unclassified Mycolicibacterium]|uniref:LysR substrate-binding domain-containing protein n=1 Tax=unclassified Mycolicibacterium TaxID=2636767 RepID=UPI001F4C3CD6|nr:LysR substrate-binding domain-containing protein [Mycolicibacterium sp. YH-1]UNB52184.1 LysR substrate-binding domain-containing protein [Mycolicibacterium sp. YH-1]